MICRFGDFSSHFVSSIEEVRRLLECWRCTLCADGSCRQGVEELLGQLYGEGDEQTSNRSFGAVPRALFKETYLPEPPRLRADWKEVEFPPEEDPRPGLAERYGISPLGPITKGRGGGDAPFYLRGSVPPPRGRTEPRTPSDAQIGRHGGSPSTN